jgi:hypothetical protein
LPRKIEALERESFAARKTIAFWSLKAFKQEVMIRVGFEAFGADTAFCWFRIGACSEQCV